MCVFMRIFAHLCTHIGHCATCGDMVISVEHVQVQAPPRLNLFRRILNVFSSGVADQVEAGQVGQNGHIRTRGLLTGAGVGWVSPHKFPS